jgi:uncharacterized protein YgbK (DUF1537 family)
MSDRRELRTRPIIAFYGDDFTGSAENLAQFHRFGLASFLFLRRPDMQAFAARARESDAIGIAGIARSLAPAAMVGEVEPIFRLFAEAGIRFAQYKLCSTFDSAPHVGNFAVVADIARRIFPGAFMPVFAAMPEFGRYTAFGNHFARFGPDVFRLDRHPSMARHPVTPIHEADLRQMLAAQGAEHAQLFDLRSLDGSFEMARRKLDELLAASNAPIVFDGTSDEHCVRVAALADDRVAARPVVALAAQGFAYGLGRHRGPAVAASTIEPLAKAAPLLVLSGSCAAQNARQIAHFEAQGAAAIRFSAAAAINPEACDRAVDEAALTAAALLASGQSVIAFTARGPDDPDVATTHAQAARLALDPATFSRRVGSALAAIAKRVIAKVPLRRVVFAGGDTSSYAVSALDPHGLGVVSGDYVTSAHVFRLAAEGAFDGLEIALKGGQVGNDEFFATLRDGRPGKAR